MNAFLLIRYVEQPVLILKPIRKIADNVIGHVVALNALMAIANKVTYHVYSLKSASDCALFVVIIKIC